MNNEILSGFNVRVYGVCFHNNKLLALSESFANKTIIKLPGGGLEFGEGTVACLKREFREELNLKIEVTDCFYIQENFITSLVNDHKQLLTLYFIAKIIDFENLTILDKRIDQIKWVLLNESNPFTLPVDRLVFEKLQQNYLTK